MFARPKLPDFDNVKAGGLATLDIPLGMTFNTLIFQLSGTDFDMSHIKEVKVLLNGKEFIREVTGEEINAINLYRGSKDNAAILLIDFTEPRSRTYAEQLATSIGTAEGVNSFKVQFKIAATADSPEIATWADVSGPRPLSLLPAIIKEQADFVSTGSKQVKFGYNADARHILKRVHFIPSGGAVIDAVTLMKNGVPAYDEVPAAVASHMQEHHESLPQAGWITVDFVEDNNTAINLMPTEDAKSLFWQLDISTAGHVDIIYELVSPLESI